HIKACKHFTKHVDEVLQKNNIRESDLVYCVSDFGVDVLPAFRLQKKYNFIWTPSFYLFVPFIYENILKRYGFPPVKYLIYYFYQRIMLRLIEKRAWGVIITNEADKKYFSPRLQNNSLPIYGGVNIEQICETSKVTKYDAIFCSRLHPQKGVSGLLDVWKKVVTTKPEVLLGIIGNGEQKYEKLLKMKAKKLDIIDNIEWLGYVNNEAKYELYAQSRLFLHPTIYDNNGMVAAEALCSGLPVIMYDLPALRNVYKEGCVKVPCFNKLAYADAILRILSDKNETTEIQPDNIEVMNLRNYWSWSNRATIFYSYFDSISRK
ncbi:MAG: glycosyltransferase family 4 protein, partial [Christensenellales bacterium]